MFGCVLRATLVVATAFALASCKLPDPKAPPAKAAANCDKPSTKGATTVPPWPAGKVTGGVFFSPKSSGPLNLTAGSPGFDLTQDLVIWAEDDLVIEDFITLPSYKSRQGTNVTLVSGGKITVHSLVGGGHVERAAPAAPPAGTDAYGDAGGNGGSARLIAGSILIKTGGSVQGQGGGSGADATADARVVSIPQFTGKKFGGASDAVGGSGGHGGDAVLCADYVKVEWSGGNALEGGWAGFGGNADANSANDNNARARGGDGGNGGDVVFGGGAQLDIGGRTVGGYGGGTVGMRAKVEDGNGDALAIGGNGGAGGTVRFMTGVSARQPAPVADVISADVPAAVNGGGPATAIAARPDPDSGKSGGNASASGGNGGKHGDTPQIPVMTPSGVQIVPGTTGKSGSGGSATATPGNGARSTSGTGAASGAGTAKGGANGDGAAAAGGTPSTPAAPSVGGAGGVATQAMQHGAP